MIPAPIVPTYEKELPVSKLKVKFRPFLVKEEKILMLAYEDGSESVIKSAIMQIMENTTFGKVDLKVLPTSDFEILFIWIRSKSVGETISVMRPCTDCGKQFPYDVNLELVDVVNEINDPKIILDEHTTVVMRHPTIENTSDVGDDPLAVIATCIEMIVIDDVVHMASEEPIADVVAWLELLMDNQLTKLSDWLESVPAVAFVDEITCPHCKAKNIVEIRGLENFFG